MFLLRLTFISQEWQYGTCITFGKIIGTFSKDILKAATNFPISYFVTIPRNIIDKFNHIYESIDYYDPIKIEKAFFETYAKLYQEKIRVVLVPFFYHKWFSLQVVLLLKKKKCRRNQHPSAFDYVDAKANSDVSLFQAEMNTNLRFHNMSRYITALPGNAYHVWQGRYLLLYLSNLQYSLSEFFFLVLLVACSKCLRGTA